METRCKVVCLYKQEGAGYDSVRKVDGKEIKEHYRSSIEVRLGAVYNPEPGSENHDFWKATPNLSLGMYIDNHAGADLFVVGKEYYLDFSEAPAK